MPPLKLGKYEVLACLASGSSGHVFLARRPRLGGYAPVCIKVAGHDGPGGQVEAVLAEGRLLSSLNHPSIVEVLDLIAEPTPYLVLEFIVGEGLDLVMDHAREGAAVIPPAVAATVVQDLLGALHHAHLRAGGDAAAHRDVSPPNIVLSYEGQTKLLDFGIAQHDRAASTVTGVIRGRPAYMSPEQITGARVDARTDVYAAGVILWELLANDRLFGSSEAGQVAWAQRRQAPSLLGRAPPVPEALAQIVERALHRAPEDRYSSAAEMAQAIAAYLEGCNERWGASTVARLLGERFPRRRSQCRAALLALEQTEYDEAQILAAFEARTISARDLDVHENEIAVPVGAEGSLDADPASRITERGPAQLGFDDRTVAEDARTLLELGAETISPELDAAPPSAPAKSLPTDGARAARPVSRPVAAAPSDSARLPAGAGPTAHWLPPAAQPALGEPTPQLESRPTSTSTGSLLSSGRFLLVLFLGLMMGIAAGAVVTWMLLSK